MQRIYNAFPPEHEMSVQDFRRKEKAVQVDIRNKLSKHFTSVNN